MERHTGEQMSKIQLCDALILRRYGGIRSKYPTLAARAAMEAARRASTATTRPQEENEEAIEEEPHHLGLAERLLLGGFTPERHLVTAKRD